MRHVLVAVVAIGCGRSEPPPAPAPAPGSNVVVQRTPEQLVAADCTGCHEADILVQQRITAKQWEAAVTKMVGWGALVDPKDQPALTAYLEAHYNGSAGPYVPEELTGDALAAIEPTDDGAFAGGVASRGRDLYGRACAPCHADNARGGPIGTNLVDRYLLYRAADFAGVTRTGRGQMPPQQLADAQIADLLAFLRTLGST